MSRAKPKNRARAYWSSPIPLSSDIKVELTEVLGLDPEDKYGKAALEKIARILSLYPLLKRGLDNNPRPTHIDLALKPVQEHADKLWKALAQIDEESYRLLRHFKIAPNGIKKEVKRLEQVAFAIRRDLKNCDSSGAPTKRAEWYLVQSLEDVFNEFVISDCEKEGLLSLKIEFITTAFQAAGVHPLPERDLKARLAD